MITISNNGMFLYDRFYEWCAARIFEAEHENSLLGYDNIFLLNSKTNPFLHIGFKIYVKLF